MFTTDFLLALLERAVKTFAQAFVAAALASQVTDIVALDWAQCAGIAGLATLLSVLTSIGSGVLPGDGPSAIGVEVLPESGKHVAGTEDDIDIPVFDPDAVDHAPEGDPKRPLLPSPSNPPHPAP